MNRAATIKYTFSFAWIPVLLTLLGAIFPFPLFSLHGGPAWIMLMFSVPCVATFYVYRIFSSPPNQKLHYSMLNSLSISTYVLFAYIAYVIVSNIIIAGGK